MQPIAHEPLPLDLAEIRSRCTQVTERDRIYARLIQYGFDYREAFQTSVRFYSNATEVLQELDLPSGYEETGGYFGLHPCLMDGALRNGMIQYITGEVDAPLSVPFMMDTLTIYKPVQRKCYAYSQIKTDKAS